MSRDDPPSPTPESHMSAGGTKAWLDGLAGRSGGGPEHDEGRLIREAVLGRPPIEMPPWVEIERRAAQAGPAAQMAAAAKSEKWVAANQPMWRLACGLAVALVLGVAVTWVVHRPEPEATMRGGVKSTSSWATWVVAQPDAAAKQLALELQALGAQVDQSKPGAEQQLRVQAQPEVQAAVNQRLAALELALDAQGRMNLRVIAP